MIPVVMRAAVAVIVIALAFLTLVPGAGSDAGLIRIFAETTAVRTVDVDGRGRTAGDLTIRGAQLVSREGRGLGTMTLICTFLGRVLPSDSSFCQAEYVLPRGKIIVSGTRQRADYMVLAVVGGTGVYSRASGVLVQSTIALGPRRERLLFSLES